MDNRFNSVYCSFRGEHLKPKYADEGSSGADVFADIKESIIIDPGEITLVPTGLRIIMDKNIEAQVRPRSGLALNHGITVLNSPGTIDSSYRGEIKIILINHGKKSFTIEPGMKIAQLVFSNVLKINFTYISENSIENTEEFFTNRGSGGFGSTGLK